MKFLREVKIGIFVIVFILFFILGYNFLKGIEFFNKFKVYFVKYKNVGGLVFVVFVIVNGMKVGKVKDIYLVINKGGEVIVEFIIEKDF